MYERAEKDLWERVHDLPDIPAGFELEDVARVGWCGEEDCATQMEVPLEVKFLGEDLDLKRPPLERCTQCGARSVRTMYVSKTA
jgi:hypothetical protein